MFERFTGPARAVVVRAQQEARQLQHDRIGTEHLLLALLSPDSGIASTVLHRAGLDDRHVRAQVVRLVGTPGRLLSDEDAAALQTIGIDLDAVLTRIEESFGPHALAPACQPAPRGWWRRRQRRQRCGNCAPRTKAVLELSLREALRLEHNYVGPEHILLGLLREGNGLAAKILVDAGITLDHLRRQTLSALDRAA